MALSRFRLTETYKIFLSAASTPGFNIQSRSVWGNVVRPNPRGAHRPNKHRLEKWRKMRGFKVFRVELPDFHKKSPADMSPEEIRAETKKMGVLQPRPPVQEAPMFISSTGTNFETYNPPEQDSLTRILSKDGAKEQVGKLTSKGKSFRATRKIRSFDEDFDPKNFGLDVAQQIYIDAHKYLSMKDEKKLDEVVTEKAFPEMMHNARNKSIYWDYVKSLEPPRTVLVRAEEVITKVYDRFGRLIHGHPHVAKDVLEYVIFEKHLSNVYGKWRLHSKIVPDWLNARKVGGYLGQIIEPELEVKDEITPTESSAEESEESEESSEESKDQKHQEDDVKETSVYNRFGKLISKYKN